MQPSKHFDQYAQGYRLARKRARHHYFYIGPTNSGKTYQAINALIAAQSGVYLAPLRLLAMEVRDKLIEAGVPCNLITGEERLYMDGAQHTASTIEMMHPTKAVDVAVIDEIQMLQDPDRGQAWTAALIGVPAKTVYICGSNAVTALCTRALDALNEPYEINYLERKTPLIFEGKSLCGARYSKPTLKNQLQKGDAIVAFSRKDVLTLSARFRHWGYQVASIYGALSPEVRRHESERFLTGNAEILVATDAIGMGLNLPIRRVVFAQTHKFDGVASRPLNATEVRQIAGRAGRYGVYETGYVNVLEDDEQIHIEHMLNVDDTATIARLPIAIAISTLTHIADKRHSNRLAECILYLFEQNQHRDALCESMHATAQYAQALIVDEFAPNMAFKDKFALACAPLSIQVPIEKDYFIQCIKSIYHNKRHPIPLAPTWLNGGSEKHLEQAEKLSQQISLYAWLSYQFPSIFSEQDAIPALRLTVANYTKQALLTQKGYGETNKEIELSMGARK
ncbi:MAG: helicase-related protein [Methylophilaceae bacterium]|nr:helicase-related protein [Methylophilaceae bacterium]MDG1821169.1 helicase-related protein [Methylophilaceae bacterium]